VHRALPRWVPTPNGSLGHGHWGYRQRIHVPLNSKVMGTAAGRQRPLLY
jgi:hypothetical protein